VSALCIGLVAGSSYFVASVSKSDQLIGWCVLPCHEIKFSLLLISAWHHQPNLSFCRRTVLYSSQGIQDGVGFIWRMQWYKVVHSTSHLTTEYRICSNVSFPYIARWCTVLCCLVTDWCCFNCAAFRIRVAVFFDLGDCVYFQLWKPNDNVNCDFFMEPSLTEKKQISVAKIDYKVCGMSRKITLCDTICRRILKVKLYWWQWWGQHYQ